MDNIPGWFGKLPSLGDFASRRLPAEFVEVWDDWLAQGLSDWRAADPAWLDAYLAAPAWCFVLGPGLIAKGAPGRGARPPGPAWAGILMPSVDRVGRYFPLTLASPVQALQAAAAPRLAHWLRVVAVRAVEALHQDWSAEQLDEALLEVSDLTWPLPVGDEGSNEFGLALERAAHQGDTALWWLPQAGQSPQTRQTAGLPTGPEFARLFGAHPIDPDLR